MREQFIQKLVAQPMEMGRARARTFLASSIARLRAERPAEDEWGDPLPKMRIEGDVAIIPVRGARGGGRVKKRGPAHARVLANDRRRGRMSPLEQL